MSVFNVATKGHRDDRDAVHNQWHVGVQWLCSHQGKVALNGLMLSLGTAVSSATGLLLMTMSGSKTLLQPESN